MIAVAYTPVQPAADEPRRIIRLLDGGWDYVHLRHPDATVRDMRNIIEALPQRLHGRIRLHGHFALTNEFNLGGLHLNSRCPQAPANYSGPLGITCHSVGEVLEAAATGRYAYATLSPIFPSLSKPGYAADFAPEEIARATAAMPVIALGGVTPERMEAVADLGFAGYAVLGSLAALPLESLPEPFHVRGKSGSGAG